MKIKIKILGSLIITGLFLFFSFASGNDNPFGDKINPYQSKEDIKKEIIGKWSANEQLGSELIRYRFEITSDKIKVWRKLSILEYGANNSEWKNDPDEIVDYAIGNIIENENGGKQIVIATGQTFGMLVINAIDENKKIGYFTNIKSDENSMFKDWEH